MQKNDKKPLIVANWKMHKMLSSSKAMLQELIQLMPNGVKLDNIVLCPPATLLHMLIDQFAKFSIKFGGQDCSSFAADEGAFTGDISATMLKDLACEYVIIGHSERRKYYQEQNNQLKAKIAYAHNAGLTAILCVGENLNQREDGSYLKFLGQTLAETIPDSANFDNTIIAYEPIWAIGTGKTANLIQIEEVHQFLNDKVTTLLVKYSQKTTQMFEQIPKIIYGGSVNAENAESILASKQVSGILVGGASLDAQKFYKIIQVTQKN